MELHPLLDNAEPCFTSLPAQTALDQAVTAMARYGKTAVMVTESGQVKGILTRSDLMEWLAQEDPAAVKTRTVGHLMTRNLVMTHPRASLEEALESMSRHRIEHLPVMEQGRLLTVVHQRQLLDRQVKALQKENGVLQEYIENLHNAAQD